VTFWSELVYQSIRLGSAKATLGSRTDPAAAAPAEIIKSRRFMVFSLVARARPADQFVLTLGSD
jgi:hypothetical protein